VGCPTPTIRVTNDSKGKPVISTTKLKSCTSIAAVLVALAAASTASAADRSKLPAFVGGAFTFDSMGASHQLPLLPSPPGGHRTLAAGHGTETSAPPFAQTSEYKASWYLDKINAAPAYAMGYTGKGVLTAVVDSGIDVNHHEFAGRISTLSRSFHYGTEPDDLRDINEDGGINGHGTMVSGIIGAVRDGKGSVGVAPGADIMSLRVDWYFREDGELASNEAIRYAAKNGAKVLNGSYGPLTLVSPYVYDEDGKRVRNPNYAVLPNTHVSAFGVMQEYEAVKAGADADIVMVFAASNEYRQQPLHAANPTGAGLYPLIRPENHGKGFYTIVVDAPDPDDPSTFVTADPSDPELAGVDFSDLQGALITVVATDRNDKIASYSNRCGAAWMWCLSAPGGDFPKDGEKPEDTQYQTPAPGGGTRWGLGTSAATPVVAGGAAVLREAFPYMTARNIIEVILTTASDIGPREIYGRGMFNLGRAIKGPYEFGAEGFAQTFDVDTKGYDSAWSNDIRGTGGLIKRGEGNLLLTGSNTYQGGTDVLGGILTLNGSLKSNLSVGAKATLRGTGRIDASLSVAGTLEPGSVNAGSVGTLRVNGDAELLGSSTYRADVHGLAGHDRLSVSGGTTLSGGTLEIKLANGVAPVNRPLDVVFSADGISGAFGTLRTNSVSAFLDPMLAYDADIVSVLFRRNGVALSSAATTPNQASVAAAADRAGAGTGAHDALVQNGLGTAAGAFDAISGEAHASVVTSAYGDAALVSRSLIGRLRQAEVPSVSALWGEGFGSWGRIATDGNAGSVETSTGGFIIGADAAVGDDYRIGIAGGFTSTETDMDARASSATNESVFGAIYGSGRWGAINARLGASLLVHDIDTTRRITFPGLTDSASSSYDGTTVQAFGELGYRFGMGAVELEPFVGASVLRLHTDPFVENGGVAALTGYGRTYDLATTTVGIRAEARFGTDLPLTVRGMLGWRHAYGDVAPKALLGLNGGTAAFGVSGVPVDRDALVAEAGLDWQVSDKVTLGVSYQGQIGSRAQEHAIKGNLTVRF